MGVMVRIEASHFVAGIIVGERAAPILKYMIGWPTEKIIKYCQKKGWKWTVR